MIHVDVNGGPAPTNAGSRVQPVAHATQLESSPPTQVVVPGQAVVPVQSSKERQPVRSRAEIVKALSERLNESLKDDTKFAATRMNFSVDDSTDELVVRIIDRKTDEVLLQLPAEEVLQRMGPAESFKGLLISTET